MHTFIETLVVFPLLILSYQFYTFSVMSHTSRVQDRCQKLGVVYMTFGIIALVFKSAPVVSFGFVLMMLGFRLMAKGLDRLDKKIYIDRFEED